jgi:hypothetical protein
MQTWCANLISKDNPFFTGGYLCTIFNLATNQLIKKTKYTLFNHLTLKKNLEKIF